MDDALFTVVRYCGLVPGRTLQIGTPLLPAQPPWNSYLLPGSRHCTTLGIDDQAYYDAVIALDSLSALGEGDCIDFLAGCGRRLATGGLLLLGLYLATTQSRQRLTCGEARLTFPHSRFGVLASQPHGTAGARYCYSEEALRRQLRRCGLTVQNVWPGAWAGGWAALEQDLVSAAKLG